MKNSKDYLKCCTRNFVNFTVVVHYLVNKLHHPPQYHGFRVNSCIVVLFDWYTSKHITLPEASQFEEIVNKMYL